MLLLVVTCLLYLPTYCSELQKATRQDNDGAMGLTYEPRVAYVQDAQLVRSCNYGFVRIH